MYTSLENTILKTSNLGGGGVIMSRGIMSGGILSYTHLRQLVRRRHSLSQSQILLCLTCQILFLEHEDPGRTMKIPGQVHQNAQGCDTLGRVYIHSCACFWSSMPHGYINISVTKAQLNFSLVR